MCAGSFLLIGAFTLGTAGDNFYEDFRGGHALPPELELIGPQAAKVAVPETGGLRLSLPAGRANPQPVGVRPRFQMRGDFEITLTYELLKIEQPRTGHGVGVALAVNIAKSPSEDLTLARYLRVDKKELLAADHRTYDSKRGNVHKTVFTPAPSSKIGRFQLKRSGPRIRFLSGSGSSGVMQVFHQLDIGSEDLNSMRFSATSGGSSAAADVRLLEIRIQADKLLRP
jgi:hypothetical protein